MGNVESGRPIKRNDHLRTASTAKAFSGAVALQLVDDGSLSLDSTIGEVLPDQPAAWAAVTLRQLLQHASGVPNYTKSPAWQAQAGTNPQATVTPEFLLGLVANKPLEFTPGSRYEYSNSDNLIIGLMAEAVTGRAYEELLQELVFSPLGLKRTSLPSEVEMPPPYIRGYDIAPPAPPVDTTGVINPCGTVLGYAGNFPAGSTLLIAATPNGRRSTVVFANEQLAEAADTKPEIFKQLRRAFRLAACAALPR